ncbi:hypothetical protein C6382_15240 [Pseudomonas sp. BBP2017]|nr:hypothetical protein C6382_15240 [Pseudomonas sp. BBP2017]
MVLCLFDFVIVYKWLFVRVYSRQATLVNPFSSAMGAFVGKAIKKAFRQNWVIALKLLYTKIFAIVFYLFYCFHTCPQGF